MNRTTVLVLLVMMGGVAYRALIAAVEWPMSGDPVFSYCYRALLISDGDWRGVNLMWHLPGYPLLLAGVTWISFGALGTYASGVVISLVSYVGLAIVVDRLIAPRVRWPFTRVIAAAFLACYETLALWASAPLTEPVYLFLLYSALLTLDRDQASALRGLGAGLLLGLACSMRLEGVAPAAGVVVFLVARGQVQATIALVAGVAAGFGWLAAQPDYLDFCISSQKFSYTISPAITLRGTVLRFVECAYHAVTAWLPFVLLLPYWMMLSIGLLNRAQGSRRAPLHLLLLAVVAPSLVAVMTSIMHKRTGMFLLPAAGIWVALGTEVLADRYRDRISGTRVLVSTAILLMLVGDITRTFVRWRRESSMSEVSIGAASGSILKEAMAEPKETWAFGAEPEVYAHWGEPLFYPFRDREGLYNSIYHDHRGRPIEFVAALRDYGFGYLAFTLRDEVSAAETVEPQQYGAYCGGQPLRSDLVRMRDTPDKCGVELIGSIESSLPSGGVTRSYVYRVLVR